MMAVLRMPDSVRQHLFGHLARPGEHFAFLLCSTSTSDDEPVFLAHELHVVPDHAITISATGYEIDDRALDDVINTAIRRGYALVEAHNHTGDTPRFSRTDLDETRRMAAFMADTTLGQPYGAFVLGEHSIYGEWFLQHSNTLRHGVIGSITAIGSHLRQLVSRNDDDATIDPVFDRQVPWFTTAGQRMLARLRVAIVGCSGTGSHVALQLAHLGIRDFVIIDPDIVEDVNLNRVVTATHADIDEPKVNAARRRIRLIAPTAHVDILQTPLQHDQAIDLLRGVDAIFGCVDRDGPRLILNRLALAYGIPYIDVATDIDVDPAKQIKLQPARIDAAGGRVLVITPDGPCAECMGEIDHREAAYDLATDIERQRQRRAGYAPALNEPSPSVVSLNALAASVAITEFAILVSGIRPPNPHTVIDILGTGQRIGSTWTTPMRAETSHSCFECTAKWRGDNADINGLTGQTPH